jgi:hypothetical protein
VEPFFKRQIEECRELARHAVDEDDRQFWQQAAARWKEQLQIFQQARPPKTPQILTRTTTSIGSVSAK